MHVGGKHLYNVSQDGCSPDVLTHFHEDRSAAWYGAHLDRSVRRSRPHSHVDASTPPPPPKNPIEFSVPFFTRAHRPLPSPSETNMFFRRPQTPRPPPASSPKVQPANSLRKQFGMDALNPDCALAWRSTQRQPRNSRKNSSEVLCKQYSGCWWMGR